MEPQDGWEAGRQGCGAQGSVMNRGSRQGRADGAGTRELRWGGAEPQEHGSHLSVKPRPAQRYQGRAPA